MLQRKQSILIHASGHFGQVFFQDILTETIGFYDIPVKISAGLDGPPETVFSVNGCQTDALSEIPVRIHPAVAGLNLLRKNHFITMTEASPGKNPLLLTGTTHVFFS